MKLKIEMLKRSPRRSAQEYIIRKRGNAFFDRINFTDFLAFIWIHYTRGWFIIKTHQPPTRYIRLLIRMGIAKALFSYRDPRDIVLSLIDHGNRARNNKNERPAFVDITGVDTSIRQVRSFLKMHAKWKDFDHAFYVRYEDFMMDNAKILTDINDIFSLKINNKDLEEILTRFEKGKTKMHNYNKGTYDRYKTEMSEEDLKKCETAFRDYLIEHGYPLTGHS